MLASRDAFLAWTRQEGLVPLEHSAAEAFWVGERAEANRALQDLKGDRISGTGVLVTE